MEPSGHAGSVQSGSQKFAYACEFQQYAGNALENRRGELVSILDALQFPHNFKTVKTSTGQKLSGYG